MSNKQGADYIFEKTQQIKKQKAREKVNKTLVYASIVFVLLAMLMLYFNTNLSKIRYININGLNLTDSKTVIEKTGVKEGDYKLFTSLSEIKRNIMEFELVKDCSVSIDLNGNLNITVTEKRPLAYYQSENGVKVLLDDRTTVEINNQGYRWLMNIPLLEGFSEEQIMEKLYDSILLVNEKILANISKIAVYPFTYDPDNVVCYFSDGNYVLCNMRTVESVNSYYSIVPRLEVSNSCIFFNKDIPNGYAKTCPWDEVVMDENSEDEQSVTEE